MLIGFLGSRGEGTKVNESVSSQEWRSCVRPFRWNEAFTLCGHGEKEIGLDGSHGNRVFVFVELQVNCDSRDSLDWVEVNQGCQGGQMRPGASDNYE